MRRSWDGARNAARPNDRRSQQQSPDRSLHRSSFLFACRVYYGRGLRMDFAKPKADHHGNPGARAGAEPEGPPPTRLVQLDLAERGDVVRVTGSKLAGSTRR